MSHALVVGGTGMLRGVCLWLAGRGCDVTVLARRHAPLAALTAGPGSRLWPAPADYRDDGALAACIRAAAAARGPIETAVCWIHSSAPRAPGLVAELMANERRPPRYFDVAGCEAADPVGASSLDPLLERPGVLYRRIILGFVVDGASSRWLTDHEIAGGVIGAIESDSIETVVGVVRPWNARPPL